MRLQYYLSSAKRVFRNNFPDATRKTLLLWVAVIWGTTFIGVAISLLLFRGSFDFGDGSTFFQFARNLADGEAIYEDFIHFRTPGSYFLQSLFIRVFGDDMSSLTLALQLEAHAFYTFVFALAVAIFLRFKHVVLGGLSVFGILLLPGYMQLRTAFALLAVVLYIQSLRVPAYRRLWLTLSGVVTGLAFTFGQEAAVMVLLTIFLGEILTSRNIQSILGKWKDALVYFIGVLVGLLPLLVYVAAYSSVSNFLYYTIYYAFVLQPQGMDLEYPDLVFTNIVYYAVLALIILIFYILYSVRRIGVPVAILLGFTVARLVTLFGRSDMGHLIFVMPEIIFLTIYTCWKVRDASFDIKRLRRFAPYGATLIVAFWGAIHISSMSVTLGIAAIILAFARKKEVSTRRQTITGHFLVVFGMFVASATVVGYVLYPQYESTFQSLSRQGVTPQSVGGVNVDNESYDRISKVRDAVGAYDPQTIFSFPIQPFYYTLADEHAARFMTFEPQTTEAEQDQTIEDLKRTKPEVVIFDPAQAAILSKSLWKISNYITANYEVAKVIADKQILWVMIPRSPVVDDQLVFSLYKTNDQRTANARDVQSPDKAIVNGLMVSPGKQASFSRSHFTNGGNSLQVSVYHSDQEQLGRCGAVALYGAGKLLRKDDICAGNGTLTIPLNSKTERIDITNKDNLPLILNDPTIIKE